MATVKSNLRAKSRAVGETLEDCSIGVAIIRTKSVGGDYTIRIANHIPFENGVNIIRQ